MGFPSAPGLDSMHFINAAVLRPISADRDPAAALTTALSGDRRFKFESMSGRIPEARRSQSPWLGRWRFAELQSSRREFAVRRIDIVDPNVQLHLFGILNRFADVERKRRQSVAPRELDEARGLLRDAHAELRRIPVAQDLRIGNPQ